MTIPKVYADFHNIDDEGQLRLTCAGTAQDIDRQGIELRDGLVLTFVTDDEDDEGQPDELLADGIVHYDEVGCCWVANVDWSALRHASEEAVQGVGR